MGLGATAAAGLLLKGCDRPVDTNRDGGTFQVLEVKWLYKTLNGRKTKLRSYNGQVPGPMITAHPGETLRIRLKNSLTPYDSTGWTGDHNIPHHLNSTNLHVHGLDVAPHLFQPLGTTDPKAPMIHIMPGETFDYVFELPKDHPPGLYWYHPHGHGSSAVQGVSGMAGAIIVRGDIDEVPEIKAARDITLAIQDIGLFPSETETDVWTYEPKQNAVWVTASVSQIGVSAGKIYMWDPKAEHFVEQPTLKSGFTTGDYPLRFFLMSMSSDGLTLLNGEPFFQETHVNPPGNNPDPTQLSVQEIRMAPGEVVRFRMLNACSDNMMPIVVERHDMHLIALDGVNFPAPRTIPYSSASGDGQVLLAPANRAEFLIQAGTPGRYAIRALAQSQGFLPTAGKVIAEILVDGPAKPMTLPGRLPTPSRYYPLIENVSGANTLQFEIGLPAKLNSYIGVDFTINGKQYQEDQVEPSNVVMLDEAQEWTLRNDHDHGGTEGHPFHIHMNHFEVIAIGGVKQPPGTIQDTVWVPVGKPVVIRMKFRQFKGKAVFHCHILPHEDTGMMQNFLVR
jgi:FtsP/CotA-like multicopper oxidase with cupredoxin domain